MIEYDAYMRSVKSSFFGYLQSGVGNPVINGALESSRFVQNLVAQHRNPAVLCVQSKTNSRSAADIQRFEVISRRSANAEGTCKLNLQWPD